MKILYSSTWLVGFCSKLDDNLHDSCHFGCYIWCFWGLFLDDVHVHLIKCNCGWITRWATWIHAIKQLILNFLKNLAKRSFHNIIHNIEGIKITTLLYDLLMNLLALFKCHHISTCIHQPHECDNIKLHTFKIKFIKIILMCPTLDHISFILILWGHTIEYFFTSPKACHSVMENLFNVMCYIRLKPWARSLTLHIHYKKSWLFKWSILTIILILISEDVQFNHKSNTWMTIVIFD